MPKKTEDTKRKIREKLYRAQVKKERKGRRRRKILKEFEGVLGRERKMEEKQKE